MLLLERLHQEDGLEILAVVDRLLGVEEGEERLNGGVESVALVDHHAVDGGVERAGGFCEARGRMRAVGRGGDLAVGEERSGESREMGPGCGERGGVCLVGVVGVHDGPDVVVVGGFAEGGAEEGDVAGFGGAGGGGDRLREDWEVGGGHLEVVRSIIDVVGA